MATDGGPLLTFRLSRSAYGLPLATIAGVAEPIACRPVPGAPRAVLGLAEWRGCLLTVVDLAALLHETPGHGPATLVRLAPPLDRTALLVGAAVRLEPAGDDGVTRLDPAAVLARLEAEIVSRGGETSDAA